MMAPTQEITNSTDYMIIPTQFKLVMMILLANQNDNRDKG